MLQVRVPDELLDRVDEHAERVGMSRAAYVRSILVVATGDRALVTALERAGRPLLPTRVGERRVER